MPATDLIQLRTDRHTYTLTTRIARGSTRDVFAATREDDLPCTVKICRNVTDNDLVVRESATLGRILSDPAVYDLASPYFPVPLESFTMDPGDGRAHGVCAQMTPDGAISLVQLRAGYAAGLPAQDAAWIARRLFMALGFMHARGVIHGAVLPEHVLIVPDSHGLTMVDFKAASQGEPVRLIETARRPLYPEEILCRERVGPATDLFMAVKTLQYVMGNHDVPRPLQDVFDTCLHADPRRRPQDAWALLDTFDETIEALWGPRTFRPLPWPADTSTPTKEN